MATLLLRFHAPLQSWGISSLFTERETAREPSKSGVIGLLCAALGRERSADISDLASLRMGVRVDREGSLEMDYQTSSDVFTAEGKISKNAVVSKRYYLADAVFLVGLEGPLETLRPLGQTIRHPKWQLFLGRKAFPPALPVWLPDGLRPGKLDDELRAYPALVEGEEKMRLIIEDEEGQFQRRDVPLNFAQRAFANRSVRMELCPRSGEKGA